MADMEKDQQDDEDNNPIDELSFMEKQSQAVDHLFANVNVTQYDSLLSYDVPVQVRSDVNMYFPMYLQRPDLKLSVLIPDWHIAYENITKLCSASLVTASYGKIRVRRNVFTCVGLNKKKMEPRTPVRYGQDFYLRVYDSDGPDLYLTGSPPPYYDNFGDTDGKIPLNLTENPSRLAMFRIVDPDPNRMIALQDLPVPANFIVCVYHTYTNQLISVELTEQISSSYSYDHPVNGCTYKDSSGHITSENYWTFITRTIYEGAEDSMAQSVTHPPSSDVATEEMLSHYPATNTVQYPTGTLLYPGTTPAQFPSTTYIQYPISTLQYPSTITTPYPNTITPQYPSTSNTQYPSTSVSQYPSTSATQYPTIIAAQYPSTSAAQYPSTSAAQYPSTSAAQYPSTSAAQYPSTSATQYPSIIAAQYPSTYAMQYPSTSALQYPSTSAVQYPSTSAVQYPSTSAVQYPSTSAVQYPGTSNINIPDASIAPIPVMGPKVIYPSPSTPGFPDARFNPRYPSPSVNTVPVPVPVATLPIPWTYPPLGTGNIPIAPLNSWSYPPPGATNYLPPPVNPLPYPVPSANPIPVLANSMWSYPSPSSYPSTNYYRYPGPGGTVATSAGAPYNYPVRNGNNVTVSSSSPPDPNNFPFNGDSSDQDSTPRPKLPRFSPSVGPNPMTLSRYRGPISNEHLVNGPPTSSK